MQRTRPVVLQVLPALDEGGAERGTVDLARYLIGQGWRALVASSGGAGESELEEAGAGACGCRSNPRIRSRSAPTSAACSG